MRRVVELRRGARPAGSGERSMTTPKAPSAPIARRNWRRGRRRGRSDRVTQVGLRRAGRPARRYCSGRRTSYTTSSRLLPEGRQSRLAGGGNAPRRAPPPPERHQHLRHGLVDPQETGGEHRHSRLARISRDRPVWRGGNAPRRAPPPTEHQHLRHNLVDPNGDRKQATTIDDSEQQRCMAQLRHRQWRTARSPARTAQGRVGAARGEHSSCRSRVGRPLAGPRDLPASTAGGVQAGPAPMAVYASVTWRV